MTLMRWEPFGDVDMLFRRMMPARFGAWPRWEGDGDGGQAMQWSPTADISETDKEYVIRAELPAVRKEDVKVTLDGGVITIRGERRQQKDDKNEKVHRMESLFGSFERSFSLPDDVKADAVRCDSKDGILTVHIPKSEPTLRTPRQITVQ